MSDEEKLDDLTVDQFCQRLIESGLMDDDQVKKYRKVYPAPNAVSFAQQFISGKKFTRFQATVLLEGRDLPLVLDRYVLLDEIGKGGMGAVYKALHQQMDRIVALKILPKSAVDSADKIKRFQREVKAAAKLHHQNIVTAFDAREDKGVYFLVMELGSGSDLAVRVRKQGVLSCAKAVDYLAQAARGLEHAHGMGIVHRDIKPGNLLLDSQGRVKILDMGLARINNANGELDNTVSQELTQAGVVMGTIAYLSPEQALDPRNADARSDIYSLGCTLYYLLTGKPLYAEDTMMKTIMAHREGAIPSLRDEREGVPTELEAIFQKMVAKQPEDRFQSMTEVISALEALDIKDEEGTYAVGAGSQAFYDTATFINTSRDVSEHAAVAGSGKPLKRRRGLIAAGLLGFVVLLAGPIINRQTPAGAVILEIDQPELIGAVVTIDGEKKITITTGKGHETIKITPDEKRHQLAVRLAGFKTFTEEFTFDTDNKKRIKVWLERKQTLAVVDEAEAQAVAESAGKNWALKFDGETPVSLDSLKYDQAGEFSVEFWATPLAVHEKHYTCIVDNLIYSGGTTGLAVQQRSDGRGGENFWGVWADLNQNEKKKVLASPKSMWRLGEAAHLTLQITKQQLQFFVNGSLIDTLDHNAYYPTSSKRVAIGDGFVGIIDEVRISSVARYTDDFKPAKRFENDEHTLALYHFDEGQGDVLKDDSGNGHHGKIARAQWINVDDDLQMIKEGPVVAPSLKTNPE